jgi:hypothetical protein
MTPFSDRSLIVLLVTGIARMQGSTIFMVKASRLSFLRPCPSQYIAAAVSSLAFGISYMYDHGAERVEPYLRPRLL